MTVPRKTFPECPVERCISVLSGRWKAMILVRLLEKGRRYSELLQEVEGMSQRVLSQALTELSSDGIIYKDEDCWSLTPLGEAMRPALWAMFDWGSLHKKAQDAAQASKVEDTTVMSAIATRIEAACRVRLQSDV